LIGPIGQTLHQAAPRCEQAGLLHMDLLTPGSDPGQGWIGWKARPLLRIRYGSEDDGERRSRIEFPTRSGQRVPPNFLKDFGAASVLPS